MQYRTLGFSGLKISVIGLGTWAIGGGDWKFGWGDQDEQEAIDTIVRAVELGINWIDTAAIYGEGRSEVLVAKAMRQISAAARPFIATKCGRVALGNGEIGKCLRRESVIAECDGSLKRLQTDCIDLYQLHWPEPDEEIDRAGRHSWIFSSRARCVTSASQITLSVRWRACRKSPRSYLCNRRTA